MPRSPQPRSQFTAPAYKVPRAPHPIDLRLDGNEGRGPSEKILQALDACSASSIRRYPSCRELESEIAERYGVEPDQVLITAGGDDAIQRLCRVFLDSTRELLLPTPTFEMIERFAAWEGAQVRQIPWTTPRYPTQAVVECVTDATSMIAMVSPNNPTGGWATSSDLLEVAQAAPGALIMVDAAYAEFGSEDLTEVALTLPNTVVLRTFSKALGLAGLRIGYALGKAEWIRAMRTAGLPYPVSEPSILLAREAFRSQLTRASYLKEVSEERMALTELLNTAGWTAPESQGNFVFAEGPGTVWVRDAMASFGIGIRAWPASKSLLNNIRITCPGSPSDFERLTQKLRVVLEPEALLFDMDGVLADVSQSYRKAIVQTARIFGCQVETSDIEDIKREGNANNDWVVTQRLLERSGISVELGEIAAAFNQLYNGTESTPGLCEAESLLGSLEQLRELSQRMPLGVVTGRPREEAEAFLTRFGIAEFFSVVITMEDAPAKPSPEPVRAALSKLGVSRAWMLGDTPDDMVAALAAGVLPVGVCAPGTELEGTTNILTQSGAARTLLRWTDILEVLP
ncbi:MAG: TIGR01548 family HAD-type hydrolase [Myxococcota bacterium]|nr:TIGR01548 family HAD-type hydrolase [Myxococcota bacterium]